MKVSFAAIQAYEMWHHLQSLTVVTFPREFDVHLATVLAHASRFVGMGEARRTKRHGVRCLLGIAIRRLLMGLFAMKTTHVCHSLVILQRSPHVCQQASMQRVRLIKQAYKCSSRSESFRPLFIPSDLLSLSRARPDKPLSQTHQGSRRATRQVTTATK